MQERAVSCAGCPVSSGGAGCAPGSSAHGVDSHFRPAGTATCSIWSTCSSTGPTWGPRMPRGTPPCTSAPSTTRSVSRHAPHTLRDCAPRGRAVPSALQEGVQSSCCNEAPQMGRPKQQMFSSSQFWLHVPDQGATLLGSRARLSAHFGFAWPLSAVSSLMHRQNQPSTVSSAKDANPIRSGPHPHSLI